jgi:uncharacterized protein (DUF58 family)
MEITEANYQRHSDRITAVETNLNALSRDLQSLTSIVSKGHELTQSEIRTLSQQIANIGKANWPTYIAAVMLILTLGSAALFPVWSRLATVEMDLKEAKSSIEEHRRIPVHPVAAAQWKGELKVQEETNKRQDERIKELENALRSAHAK